MSTYYKSDDGLPPPPPSPLSLSSPPSSHFYFEWRATHEDTDTKEIPERRVFPRIGSSRDNEVQLHSISNPRAAAILPSVNQLPVSEGRAWMTERMRKKNPRQTAQTIPIMVTGGYKCEYPGCTAAPFSTQYLLNSHANVHSANRPHFCPIPTCPRAEGGKGFKRKNEMIRHQLVHTSPGYTCPFCPDQEHRYPRPDNLQRHVRVHHVDKDKDDPQLREVLSQRPDRGMKTKKKRQTDSKIVQIQEDEQAKANHSEPFDDSDKEAPPLHLLPQTKTQASAPNDDTERRRNPQAESYSNNQVAPPTDSGYASVAYSKFKEMGNLAIPGYNETTDDAEIQPSPEEACVDATDKRPESEQHPKVLDSEDTKTIYSDTSSIAPLQLESYISELADELFNEIRFGQVDGHILDRVCTILPDLLKSFALRVGHGVPTKMHRVVMFFVHMYRHKIVEYFKNRYFHEQDTIHDKGTGDSNKMHITEIISRWRETLPDPEDLVPPDADDMTDIDLSDETGDEDIEEISASNLSTYRDFIFRTPAYEWLLASLRKELILEPAEPNYMEAIRGKITESLPASQRVSSRRSAQVHRILLEINWDPLLFYIEQGYSEGLEDAIERAITLTGSAKDAQALATVQYLCQTWPSSGNHIIRLVKDVLRSGRGNQHTCDLPDKTKLTAWIHRSKFMVEAFGTGDSVAEVGEQFAWLGAALRSSPYEHGIAYSSPFIKDIYINNAPHHPVSGAPSGPEVLYKIDFGVEKGEDYIKLSNGQCWYNLFRNPVVVQGYPIPRRPERDTGLEIPLGVMAALAQARRVTPFDGKLLVKGFCTMLIPTKQMGDLVVWHMLFNENGSHISYADPRIRTITTSPLENMSFSTMETARHILGWCSNVKNYAGAPDANYNIDWCGLKNTQEGFAFDKVYISSGKLIVTDLAPAIGKKDIAIHLKSRDDYISQLKWVAQRYVILYDVGDRRAWLVDGASALLHLVRRYLKHEQTGDFKHLFLLKPEDMREADSTHTGKAAAIAVLTDESNKNIKLYPKSYDPEVEQTAKKSGGQTYHRFKHKVEEIYSILEQMFCHQANVEEANGIGCRVKSAPRQQLEGFDFMDIATGEDRFQARVINLRPTGKGWVDFTRAIHAVTLFGHGFGELFKPSSVSGLCPSWLNVPKGEENLAVCVSDIKEILRRKGSNEGNSWRLVDDIHWRTPGIILEACQCATNTSRRRCDRVQLLLPARFLDAGYETLINPFWVGQSGAVIFGHSSHFPLQWEDYGDPQRRPPEETEPFLSSEEVDAQFHDSGIGSALDSSSIGAGNLSPMMFRSKSTDSIRNGDAVLMNALKNDKIVSEKESGFLSPTSSGLQHSRRPSLNSPLTEAQHRISSPSPPTQDYHVGWICAVQTEYVVALELLDEEFSSHSDLSIHDDNAYTLGRIGDHYVVIACLAKGKYGISSAASVAKDMRRSFPNIRIGLMVGIGGGAPSKKHDIRLGDVVVSTPQRQRGGVVHYEFGKAIQNKTFECTGSLDAPPLVLLNALQKLGALHERYGHRIAATVNYMVQRNPRLRKYQKPDPLTDVLYRSSFSHPNDDQSCAEQCVQLIDQIVRRPNRDPSDDDPAIHYGLIASADRLMKDAHVRDHLSEAEGVLCFEMEAAGLMDQFPCVVIRGICDYSDTHKNDLWQGYAAAAAAAYAKELLEVIPGNRAHKRQRQQQLDCAEELAEVYSGERSRKRPRQEDSIGSGYLHVQR